MTRATVAQHAVHVGLLQYVRVSLPLLAGIPDVSFVPQICSLDVNDCGNEPRGKNPVLGRRVRVGAISAMFYCDGSPFSNELKLTHVLLSFFHVVALQHAAWTVGGGTSCGLTWDMPLGSAVPVGDNSFPEPAHYCSVVSAVQSEE